MPILRAEVAVVGSGFAGSLMARVLAVLGSDVILIERGAHPRFAIGESTTPLANLSLERLARRYDLPDCRDLAAHGRWLARYPELRRGLKRGFTFYRHHPGAPFANRGLESERLLVAASSSDAVADSHWVRADVDHHFVRAAVAAGVDYRDRTEITAVALSADGARLACVREGDAFEVRAAFVIDASGPGGLAARHLGVPARPKGTATRSAIVYGHFTGARLMSEVVPGLPRGPYPDDRAAVHHVIDEGWMYSLRFDDGVTSAGFLLSPDALRRLDGPGQDAARLWGALLGRYPTLAAAFGEATPLFPVAFRPRIQHRLAHAAGERWVMLPHSYAFIDPLFSTGIAWSLRAIERLATCFEPHGGLPMRRRPTAAELERYAALLAAEAGQIDTLVAGAYDAMSHFDLFAAHTMLYFATVSFAEVRQRVAPTDDAAWAGFLGIGDPACESLPRDARARLGEVLRDGAGPDARRAYASWVAGRIAPRNVAGLADPARHNLYPLDLDGLIERHALLGMSREQLGAALPALRGTASEPPAPHGGDRSISRSVPRLPAPETPAPR